MTYSVAELIALTQEEKCKYVFFWGHKTNVDYITKTCFSQWYPSVFEDDDGNHYKSAEHYMMAQKALVFKSPRMFEKILNSPTADKARGYGRLIPNFTQQEWDRVKFDIVVQGNYFKFEQNEPLKEFLLNTKERILVEASPVDKIWGIGLIEDHPDAQNPLRWNGTNMLGFALMKVRNSLRT